MILPPLATCALGAHPYCHASDAQPGRHVVTCLSDKHLLVFDITDDEFRFQYLLNANFAPGFKSLIVVLSHPYKG